MQFDFTVQKGHWLFFLLSFFVYSLDCCDDETHQLLDRLRASVALPVTSDKVLPGHGSLMLFVVR